jgi:putative PIN family toxin of toxin-antitoxin system
MKIVLDTNAFLVAIPPKSQYRPIFDALLQKKFSLAYSTEILLEYEEILKRKANPIVVANALELLSAMSNIEKIEVYFHWNLIETDKDDNKFVDCAIAANADYIVTNDKHFQTLKTIDFPKISIISVEEFKDLLL